MAGEIQLNSTSFASESGGTITINNATVGSAVAMSANQACVKTAMNASGSAPIYACRAWINFDGTSASIGTGRANGNVSGVTDNGTGNYTITFSTAMPDANNCAVAINDLSSNGAWYVVSYMTSLTTTSVQYRNNSHYDSNLNPADCATISCCVLR